MEYLDLCDFNCQEFKDKVARDGEHQGSLCQKSSGRRKGGMAFRRKMKAKHLNKRVKIISKCGYNPAVGRVDWEWENETVRPTGRYIKYPRNSNAQKYFKRHSNKIIRRKKVAYNGNQYRKVFDYWWTLY